ncbi:MAG TPA: M23 family metallopeptidase [Candidatus Dormibacteraeota bacterium]|nr:M23 family metallopeptidase [Candidatus Dormibacteraeota bacterium]
MARGIPRLAAHGWALGLAVLVLLLAPLAFKHPIAEAHATAGSPPLSRSMLGESALRFPATAAQVGVAPAPVHHQGGTADGLAADIIVDPLSQPPTASDPGGSREHVMRFVWPTHGVITQSFWQYHPGIDIAADAGTQEFATDGGQVVFAGWGSYGIYVEIDHGNGFHSIYGHMSAALVKTGDVVTQSQMIGLMGATGRASGSHLHFEIRYQGAPQNPIDLLPS